MSSFAELAASHAPQIRQELPASAGDPHEWLVDTLLGMPAVTSGISALGYTVAQSMLSSVLTVGLEYETQRKANPVFLVRDAFELTCAMSMALRMHLAVIDIVVDNRTEFVPDDRDGSDFYSMATNIRESLGEDLECAQARRTSQRQLRLCQNKVISYRLALDYYEEPRLLNALSCVVAEHAKATMDRVGRDPVAIMDALMGWFRENVQYADTGSIHDHSAVGLVVNGTSVCQGIAVYANQFLWHCGIPNRYVHGHGRRERHAWNVVRVGGSWEHVDYTFALTDGRRHILPTSESSRTRFRTCHTWDESEYSAWRNDWVANAKHSLGHSVISMIPNEDAYSVNGCVVDTTYSHRIMPVMDGKVFVDIGGLSQLIGGGWGLRDAGTRISVCFDSNVFSLDSSDCRLVDGTCYMVAEMLPRLGISVNFGSHDVVNVRRSG